MERATRSSPSRFQTPTVETLPPRSAAAFVVSRAQTGRLYDRLQLAPARQLRGTQPLLMGRSRLTAAAGDAVPADPNLVLKAGSPPSRARRRPYSHARRALPLARDPRPSGSANLARVPADDRLARARLQGQLKNEPIDRAPPSASADEQRPLLLPPASANTARYIGWILTVRLSPTPPSERLPNRLKMTRKWSDAAYS